MADIFEEVEEGLAQDKWSERWRKYGVFAYLAAALIIGGVALQQYLIVKNQEQIAAKTTILEGALESLDAGNYEASGATLTELAGSDARLAPVAAHYLAQVRLEGNGDAAAAASVLTDASEASQSATGKLALLKSAYLVADDMSRSDLEAKLAPLREEETAFGAMALELIAAKALAEGDVEFARSEFTYLRLAPNVPTGVAQRADRALAALPPLSIDEIDPLDVPDETPAEETSE